MAKDKTVTKSQKSNRPVNHKRFKDLYTANQQPPTTPDLAGREPRQVPQTPSSDTTTTAATTVGSETQCTPVTKKTPAKKKPPKPKRSKKATKWSHVPSASDGDATHFENFENEGGAQPAIARMKTRKLQWSRETVTESDGQGTLADESAGESFRQDPTNTDGTAASGSAGSADTMRLPPLELTQVDDEFTKEDPDKLPELSPQPSPPKPKEKEDKKEKEKDAAKESPQKKAAKDAAAKEAIVTTKEVAKAAQPTQRVQPKQQEATKRENRTPDEKKTAKPSSRENKKPAVTPAPKAPSPKADDKKKTTTRENEKPVPAPSPAPKALSPKPDPVPQHHPKASKTFSREEPKRKETKGRSREEPMTANYRQAVALMKILKRNNYLENALRFEEGEKIRKHYEAVGFNQPPPPHILALLNKALDFVLESVLFRAEDLDTVITNDMRVFIIKKQEARQAMLEVILHRPHLMPTKWGGAKFEAKRSKSSKKSTGGKRGWFASFFR